MTALTDKIGGIITPSLEAMGYALVLVRMRDAGGKRTLQVMAERGDGRDMSVDDCEKISHTVSALLDVEDPVDGAYHLEISSPGIDRPLVKTEDYKKYAGSQVKLETALPLNGRRRFTGVLAGSDEREVKLDCAGEIHAIPYANIQFAKLVLTDELIREHLRKHKKETKH
jgi:ribosome maturation factor RimP